MAACLFTRERPPAKIISVWTNGRRVVDEPAAALQEEEEEEWQGGGGWGQKVLQRTLRSSSLEKLHQQLLPLLHLLLLHIIAINHIGKVYGGSQPPPPPQKTNSWKLCTSAAKLLPPKNPIWPPPSSSPPSPVIPAIGHLRPVCRAKYSKVVPKKLRC